MNNPAIEPSPPPARCDLTVVGGGIVGLAVARELLLRDPHRGVCVLERETEIAAHQSSHNSGVIHAGIYYAPGSLKARLCVEGAREMYEYCERNQIPFERCGKLILATEPSELPRLNELQRRGLANGLQDLRRIDRAEIEELEPHARAIAGLHSPSTGIVDFSAVAHAYARDILRTGGTIATGCEVVATTAGARTLRIAHSRGVTETAQAIFCAGAWSDRLAVAGGSPADPRIVPFRGAYLRLAPSHRHLLRSLIYPVPDPSLPFLGVHLTRTIDGEVLIGPTALIAGARDAYDLCRLRRKDLLDTLSWPGTWRLLARWWGTGLSELHHALLPQALLRAAARYVPELRDGEGEPAFAGIRAQALGRDGTLIDDFSFSRSERALHVRNAPSPAATSSLAIARHVVDRAEQVFALG